MDQIEDLPIPPTMGFSHIHLYVDNLKPLEHYKAYEDLCNKFSKTANTHIKNPAAKCIVRDSTAARADWVKMAGEFDQNPDTYKSQNRDLVKQLISGLGFRVTGMHKSVESYSLLITSEDEIGVQYVVTQLIKSDSPKKQKTETKYEHFGSRALNRFYDAHCQRQGISALAFEVIGENGVGVDGIKANYEKLHPKLLPEGAYNVYEEPDGTTRKMLEVYAYYKGKDGEQIDEEDDGTLLRFIEVVGRKSTDGRTTCILPGLAKVDATFDGTSFPAYCDHWVSNVVSRTGFLDTLKDTLGFTPKVDFNAGVVAAGEAQIESTVTGNTTTRTFSKDAAAIALKDQSQVYLPINNALSPVGHVHGFIEEIGQGVQHVASRVVDLVGLIQRANDFRKITGEGFTFLNIPRSYYGVLSPLYLTSGNKKIDNATAELICSSCESVGICSEDGAVDLEISKDVVEEKLNGCSSLNSNDTYNAYKDEIVKAIMESRYCNMFSLLGSHMSEDTYVAIVRNKILVDVQGQDLLFQIFTSNILQNKPGDESPFLEFIQRVCSECVSADGCPAKIKPGCGGFGIRNFLTLFLSIEVSKAMMDVRDARKVGDTKKMETANLRVKTFTDQLNEANPILTDISDAMTAEGDFKDAADFALKNGDKAKAEELLAKAKVEMEKKLEGNQRLMVCSSKYNTIMKEIRGRA